MTGKKLFGNKEQASADKQIKDAGMWDVATNLYLYFDKKQDNVASYLLGLKLKNKANDFERYFSGNRSWSDLWFSPSFSDLVYPMVKHWYKKKFQSGRPPLGYLTQSEMPTGLIRFGVGEYNKRDSKLVTDIEKFAEEVLGDFKYNPTKTNRFIFLEDGAWFLSNDVNSYIPYDTLPKIKPELKKFIGHEVEFVGGGVYTLKAVLPDVTQVQPFIDAYTNRDVTNKLEDLDVKLLLNNLYVPAQSSAFCDVEHPIYHELRISGKDYPVSSLAFFQAVNSLQSDVLNVYYDAQHIILESKNGAFAIVGLNSNGLTYAKTLLGGFKKGMTIRETERLELMPSSKIEIPEDLLLRRPIIQSIIDRQRLLKTDIYSNLLSLIFEYINSYTKKTIVIDKDKTSREVVSVDIDVANALNYNYVYEVEEIYWKYNNNITIEELLAYFIIKGNNESYKLLCLKVLGIDYMYHYNEIVDALIEKKELMIENIRVDSFSRQLLELEYNYKHLYASGDIYQKLERLYPNASSSTTESNYDHIIHYFGEQLGNKIIEEQYEILKNSIPETCVLVPNEQRRQLELDLSNSIFWKSFPELGLKSNEKGTILKLYLSYLHSTNVSVLGEVTKPMVENGYMLPITRKEFTINYVLNKWEHNGKPIKFKSASQTDILVGLFPHLQQYRPLNKTIYVKGKKKQVPDLDSKGKQKMEPIKMKVKDFLDKNAKPPLDEDWMIKEGKDVKKLIDARYYDLISEVKEEGNRIFNLMLQNELTSSSQQIVESVWNKKFNAYKSPSSDKIPAFLRLARYFGTDVSREFELNSIQLSGIKFIISRGNSALLAHEVGLGKTLLSIGAISHLFETGDLNRIMVLTPKAVHPKFVKEAKGDATSGFRGAIPHINILDFGNAKPKMFLPEYNKVTKQITLDRIKKYTSADMVLYEQYDVFFKDLELSKKYRANKQFSPEPSTIDLIRDKLSEHIPNWISYEFINLMIMDCQKQVRFIEKEIRERTDSVREKYLKQKQSIPKYEKLKIANYYGKQFTIEIMNLIESVQNIILDELGTYLPYVMMPKTLIMATHIALDEFRPSEKYLTTAALLSDDADNLGEIRPTTDTLMKGVMKQAITFNKLNIDGIIVDEVHNFNELVSHVRPRYIQQKGEKNNKYYEYNKLKAGGNDSEGLNTFRYWYKIGNASKKKLTMLALSQEVKSRIMLSATPFTEGPLHALSVINMVNRQKLVQIGYGSSYTFFENFIFEKWKAEPKIEANQLGLAASVDRYRNMSGLCNFMRIFTDFKVGGEELDAKRPKKYVIPDYEDENIIQNEEDKVFRNINSYVPNTPEQEIIKQRISDFISGKIEKEQVCKESLLKQIVKVPVPLIEVEEEDDDDTSEGEAKGQMDAGAYAYNKNAGVTFKREARMFQAKSMQEKMNISPYFLECVASEVNLPTLKGNVKDANGNDVYVKGVALRNAALNFVQNSPKLYYTIGCITSVLIQHLTDGLDKPDWSGQVIYLNMGKKFIFEGESYDAYKLIKEYLVYHLPMGIDLDEDEVSMIYGGKDDDLEELEGEERSPTQIAIDNFNSGKIKVLIGSSKIKEGIDLQKNASVIYLLQAEYNPTVAIQLEGRIWRQGNKWGNVRVVYVLAYNSIDKFIYSKVKMKIMSIKGIMSAGDCDLNKTHIFSLDPAEVQSELTTDPDDNARLWWQGEESSIRKQSSILNTQRQQLIRCKNEYPKVKEKLEVFLKQMNELSKVLEEVKLNGLRERVISDLRTEEHDANAKIKTRQEIEKEADKIISSGQRTLNPREKHTELTDTMGYSDFQMRLEYIRSNYGKAKDLGGNKKKETVKQMKMDMLMDTQQQIYWKTIINAGFEDYSDYYSTLEKFLRGGVYDEILSSFTSLVTSVPENPLDPNSKSMTESDIPDIIESKDKQMKLLADRIKKKDIEVQTQKDFFIKKMEAMRLGGAFDIQTQIDAFSSTNYLLKLKNP